MPLGCAGFSSKATTRAELRGFPPRQRARGHGDVGARFLVERQHLVQVHPVDVIGAEDRHHVGVEVVHHVEVLQHGIRGPAVPGRAEAHLRGDDGDEVVGQHAGGPPGQPQVLDERLRLVLHQHVEGRHLRVDEVGQDEVDDAVAGA
jgi:hypothetical protein